MKQKQLKLKLLLVFLLCTVLSFGIRAEEETGLKIRYTFDRVTNKTVPDESGLGHNATLMSNASVLAMGKYNVLSLGNGTGYLDMGKSSGNAILALNNYTVSVYYRVDMTASLVGAGYFLWSFSQLEANNATGGPYMAYRLNAQRFATSTGGYTNESAIELGKAASLSKWQHVVYRQSGTVGELFLDGKLVGKNTSMPVLSKTFTSSPAYNWIGRAPFGGDNYLKNALVYDFRLYDQAVTNERIAEWAVLTDDLEYEFTYGSVGDFTKLSAYITQCNTFLHSAVSENYPPMAVVEFKDAITVAQEMVDDRKASQFAINDCLTRLTAAYNRFKATEGLEFIVSSMPEYRPAKGFKHPGALHTQEDFDRVKALLEAKDPVIVAAYNNLKSNAYSQSNVTTSPVETIIRGGGVGENYINAARAASMAYLNALRWKISGDKAHAEKAVQILNLWAGVCKGIGGDSNFALASGLYGYEFANAAELMRDYEGWASADFKKVQEWMLNVWYPYCISFLRVRNGTWDQGRPGHYWSNWGLCNALAVMSIGVFCDNVFVYNQGVSFYKYDQVGSFNDHRTPPILNDGLNEFIGNLVPSIHKDERGPYGYLGQMQESGRDQGHALMALGLSVDICQIGWNQGDDLFSLKDNRLAAGIEYLAAYNSGTDNLPWTEYWYQDVRTAIHNSWKMYANNEGGRGAFRPYWDRIIGHYEGVKGVKMAFSHAMKDKQPVDNAGCFYGQTSGAYDHLGFSTLMCTRPAVTPEEAPILITPTLVYNGVTYAQNELGGLVNTYRNTGTTAVPVGSVIKLIPKLPDGVTDTGNWQWEDGTSAKDLEIIAENSAVYRVTYTNEKGVKGTQMYSIAVKGDCDPNELTPSIVVNGMTLNDTVVTVQSGASFTLSAQNLNGELGWGSYRWNNGGTTSSIDVENVRSDRTYSVIYTNQGGRQTMLNFHIRVNFMFPSLSVDGGSVQETHSVVVKQGQTVKLMPMVPSGKEDGIWEWSNGALTKDLLIENVQSTDHYSVSYTYKNKKYSMDFHVYIPASGVSLADGNYYIKDATHGTYLTNDVTTLIPTFLVKGGETQDAQVWNITKEGARYKITSTADSRFLNEFGQFATGIYNPALNTYTLYGVEDGDLYAVQNGRNAGQNYWAINSDGTLKGKGSISLNGYPFEIIPAYGVDIVDVSAGDFSVYPNPVQDELTVSLEGNTPEGALFTLLSVDGKPVKAISCKAGRNTILLTGLPNGLYFGVFNRNGREETVKIMKR